MVLGRVYEPQSQYPVNALRAAAPAPSTMRYYRLWIYTCNALLFVSVLGFCIVACNVLVLDPRRLLLPGLSLTQPSFLYAYLALLFQSGLLQLIGCLGAQRLNERLLNVYWLLILVLLLGDALLGVFWLFKFERIASELRPLLKHSLTKYGTDTQFTALWDGIQSQHRCCGVHGYHDFAQTNITDVVVGVSSTTMPVELPASCCRERPSQAAAQRRDPYHTLMAATTTPGPLAVAGLGAGAAVTEAAATAMAGAAAAVASLGARSGPPRATLSCKSGGIVFTAPCHHVILAWLTQTAHVLFVIGYCVIAFIKLCFLGILRAEVKLTTNQVQECSGKGLLFRPKSKKREKIFCYNTSV